MPLKQKVIFMDTISNIQDHIIADFSDIGDSFDQYAYLIELSCIMPPMDESKKTPENIVRGCQSRVWISVSLENGLFSFTADSDTLIIKGILYLLQKLFCGQTPRDVASAQITFLQATEIMETFEVDRQKGISYIVNILQKKAAELAAIWNL